MVKMFAGFMARVLICPVAVAFLLTGCVRGAGGTLFGSNDSGVWEEWGDSSFSPNDDDYKSMGVIADTAADVFREPDITSQRVTQALFNQPVRILEDAGEWMKIETAGGAKGFIKSGYVDRDCASIRAEHYNYRIVVTAKAKTVYSQPMGGLTLKEVVMGTELFVVGRRGSVYKVALPGSMMGWISESGTIRIPAKGDIAATSAADFAATAERLKGTCYMQGGISSRGIDFSGLIYMCARINGIDMPADAKLQLKMGKEVAPEDIRTGDLIFLGGGDDAESISYIGIYKGDGQFIHADKQKGYVTVSNLSEERFGKKFMRVRRIFDE